MSEKKVFQSRWGFHPVSFESSKKLRYINSIFAESQHKAGAWTRWFRKKPHNRVFKRVLKDAQGLKVGKEIVKDDEGKPIYLKEPRICSLFHSKVLPNVKLNGSFSQASTNELAIGHQVLNASRIARTPQPNPESVIQIQFSEEEIERLYNLVKNWKENINTQE